MSIEEDCALVSSNVTDSWGLVQLEMSGGGVYEWSFQCVEGSISNFVFGMACLNPSMWDDNIREAVGICMESCYTVRGNPPYWVDCLDIWPLRMYKGDTMSFSLDLDVGSLSGWVNDNVPVELCTDKEILEAEGRWFPAVFVHDFRSKCLPCVSLMHDESTRHASTMRALLLRQ